MTKQISELTEPDPFLKNQATRDRALSLLLEWVREGECFCQAGAARCTFCKTRDFVVNHMV